MISWLTPALALMSFEEWGQGCQRNISRSALRDALAMWAAYLEPTLCTSTVTTALLPFTKSFPGKYFLAIKKAPWSANPSPSPSSSSDTSTEPLSCAMQPVRLLISSRAAKAANHLLSITLPNSRPVTSPTCPASLKDNQIYQAYRVNLSL